MTQNITFTLQFTTPIAAALNLRGLVSLVKTADVTDRKAKDSIEFWADRIMRGFDESKRVSTIATTLDNAKNLAFAFQGLAFFAPRYKQTEEIFAAVADALNAAIGEHELAAK